MTLSKEDIQHIAELARLNLTAEEEKKFRDQLGSILGYIGQLSAVDTARVEPTAQVSGLTNIWRADEVRDWDIGEIATALNQGELEDGQVKVKRVL
jgi:aspartyl-tRNA(Asn)/glutamyl-tRNA(Gln) amidotransferase subunit C